VHVGLHCTHPNGGASFSSFKDTTAHQAMGCWLREHPETPFRVFQSSPFTAMLSRRASGLKVFDVLWLHGGIVACVEGGQEAQLSMAVKGDD